MQIIGVCHCEWRDSARCSARSTTINTWNKSNTQPGWMKFGFTKFQCDNKTTTIQSKHLSYVNKRRCVLKYRGSARSSYKLRRPQLLSDYNITRNINCTKGKLKNKSIDTFDICKSHFIDISASKTRKSPNAISLRHAQRKSVIYSIKILLPLVKRTIYPSVFVLIQWSRPSKTRSNIGGYIRRPSCSSSIRGNERNSLQIRWNTTNLSQNIGNDTWLILHLICVGRLLSWFPHTFRLNRRPSGFTRLRCCPYSNRFTRLCCHRRISWRNKLDFVYWSPNRIIHSIRPSTSGVW